MKKIFKISLNNENGEEIYNSTITNPNGKEITVKLTVEDDKGIMTVQAVKVTKEYVENIRC